MPEQQETPTTEGGAVIHRRTIEIESVEDGDGLRVRCTLRDTRPFMGGDVGATAHDMTLTLHVRESDRVIDEVEVDMRRYPHGECIDIEPKYQELLGLAVTRGYTRQVKERFAGVAGCNHLEHLATVLAPAMVQAMASLSRKHHDEAGPAAPRRDLSWLHNTCHVWRDGGPAQEKVALGWPNAVPREFPSVRAVELRARLQRDAEG